MLNGTDRHVVGSIYSVSAVGVLGNFMYWFNRIQRTVMRALKLVDADPLVLAKLNYPVVDLKVFSKERQNCKLCHLLFTQNTGHFALLNEWQFVDSRIRCAWTQISRKIAEICFRKFSIFFFQICQFFFLYISEDVLNISQNKFVSSLKMSQK